MSFDVHPLTPDVWPALEQLFCDSTVCSRCWCMYWRVGPAYRRRPPRVNKAAFQAVVEHEPPPGLIALDDGKAVGWCQVTPRADLLHLDRTWRLGRLDDSPVWSISCFYVRKAYRQRGLTSVLISAGIAAASQAGAHALEAYPVDRTLSRSATFTGIVSTFERAGFETVARRTPARPIMRYRIPQPQPS